MMRATASPMSFAPCSGTSTTSSSWTCRMRRARGSWAASQSATPIIARLMMSAAVPCIGALLRIAGVDVGQVQPAAEHGSDVAEPPRAVARRIHVAAHARVALEVAVDVSLGLAAFEAELLREPEGGHSIDQSEVDGLGGPT